MTDLESLRRLDGHLAQCGNENDWTDFLIAEAICLGIDTKEAIVAALEALGRNSVHVRIRLETNAKLHPDRRPWFCDTDGRYHNQS